MNFNFKHEVFPNAPIVEAMLDIQVELPEDFSYKSLEMFADEISDTFPKKEEKKQIQAEFSLEGEQSSEIRQKIEKYGFVCRSEDSLKAIQVFRRGFSFSHLKPYKNWKNLREEAEKNWSLYKKIIQPKGIKRLTLRYINKLVIPLPIKDLKEYVLTAPDVSQELPQEVEDLLMRLVVPGVNKDIYCAIVLAIDKQGFTDKELPLIFDIEAFKNVDSDISDKKIWAEFETLCAEKNNVFFHSTTETAKEMWR